MTIWFKLIFTWLKPFWAFCASKTSYLGRTVTFLYANNYPNVGISKKNIQDTCMIIWWDMMFWEAFPSANLIIIFQHMQFKGVLIGLAVWEFDRMSAKWLAFLHCQKVVLTKTQSTGFWLPSHDVCNVRSLLSSGKVLLNFYYIITKGKNLHM